MTPDRDLPPVAPADLLTLGNSVAGFLAIVTFSIETGIIPGYPDPLVAAVFIGVGLVLDALDGPVARRFGSSALGGPLDTLADLTTFVVAPAVFILEVYGPARWFLAVFTAVLVLLMGTLRLARFEGKPGATSEKHTFRGLPTPWAAVAVVILILLEVPALAALPLTIILAVLMLSHVTYPKSRERAVYLTIATAATAATILLGLLFVPQLHTLILFVALGIALFGIAGAPFLLVRREEAEDPPSSGDLDDAP